MTFTLKAESWTRSCSKAVFVARILWIHQAPQRTMEPPKVTVQILEDIQLMNPSPMTVLRTCTKLGSFVVDLCRISRTQILRVPNLRLGWNMQRKAVMFSWGTFQSETKWWSWIFLGEILPVDKMDRIKTPPSASTAQALNSMFLQFVVKMVVLILDDHLTLVLLLACPCNLKESSHTIVTVVRVPLSFVRGSFCTQSFRGTCMTFRHSIFLRPVMSPQPVTSSNSCTLDEAASNHLVGGLEHEF